MLFHCHETMVIPLTAIKQWSVVLWQSTFINSATWNKSYALKSANHLKLLIYWKKHSVSSVDPRWNQNILHRVGVSSCECIACFWSSSFMRALLIDCSFSVFVWFLCYNLSNYLFIYLKSFKKDCHVINNSNVAKELYFIVFNCKI